MQKSKNHNARIVGGRRVVGHKKMSIGSYDKKVFETALKKWKPYGINLQFSQILIIKPDMSQILLSEIPDKNIFYIQSAQCLVINGEPTKENVEAPKDIEVQKKEIEEYKDTRDERRMKKEMGSKNLIKKEYENLNIVFETKQRQTWFIRNGELWLSKNNDYLLFGQLQLMPNAQQDKEEAIAAKIRESGMFDHDHSKCNHDHSNHDHSKCDHDHDDVPDLVDPKTGIKASDVSETKSNETTTTTVETTTETKKEVLKNESGFSEEDINMVMVGATCTKEQAIKALIESKGDVVNAVMSIPN